MDSAAVYSLDTSSGKITRKADLNHPRFDVALASAADNYTSGTIYAVGGGIHNTTKDGQQVISDPLGLHLSISHPAVHPLASCYP